MEQGKNDEKTNIKTQKKGHKELVKRDKAELKTIPKEPLMTIDSEEKKAASKDDDRTDLQIPSIPEERVSEIESLKASLKEKTKLADDYFERLARIQADFENYQKRAEKERNDFKNYANAQLIRDLLLVLDDFRCALSMKDEGLNKELLRGFRLIYENFLGMLEKEGLSIIEAESEKFDPWKHEAVEMVPTKEHPEHTILCVLQPGYRLRDKILRPAKVRVAIGPREGANKEDMNDKNSEKNEIE